MSFETRKVYYTVEPGGVPRILEGVHSLAIFEGDKMTGKAELVWPPEVKAAPAPAKSPARKKKTSSAKSPRKT